MNEFDLDAFRKATKEERKKMLERKTKKELAKICKRLGLPSEGHATELASRLLFSK